MSDFKLETIIGKSSIKLISEDPKKKEELLDFIKKGLITRGGD